MQVLYDGQKYLKSDLGGFSDLFKHENVAKDFSRKGLLTFGTKV
jgi:hypothetical protein